jgi:hypothetical protein
VTTAATGCSATGCDRLLGCSDFLHCVKRTTDAVNRLLHHAHVIVTDQPSHRLEEALAGKGVPPGFLLSTCREISCPPTGRSC